MRVSVRLRRSKAGGTASELRKNTMRRLLTVTAAARGIPIFRCIKLLLPFAYRRNRLLISWAFLGDDAEVVVTLFSELFFCELDI